MESEDIIDSRFTADEEETEDEDILGDVFGDDIQEEEEIFHDFSEEEEEIPEEILPESMRSPGRRLLMRNFSQKRRNWNVLLIP